MFIRYPIPNSLDPDENTTGFMSLKEARHHWHDEDFAPIVDVKVIHDETGKLTENIYRFTPRRPVREGESSAAFSVKGPQGPLSYQHEPLDPDLKNDQIRLITLLPGAGLDPLRCTLTTHDFPSDVGKYTCLSYVWGSSIGTYPMHVDGALIGITENLMAALWHIRHERKPVRLWIDALCINQTDNLEKTRQVKMMRDVYERAHRLISWLGPAQSDTSSIPRDLIRLCLASSNILTDWHDDEHTRRRFVNALSRVNWVNLRPIFDSSYWTRVWILQEVAVRKEYRELIQLYYGKSKTLRYIKATWRALWHKLTGQRADYLLYGNCKISFWRILVINKALWDSHYDPQIMSLRDSLPIKGNFNMDLFSSSPDGFTKITRPSSIVLIIQLMQCVPEAKDFAGAYRQACYGLRATQDRDRLFAFAGLYDSFNIIADYSKPDTEIVLDIAEKIIESVKQCSTQPPILFENHGLRPSLQGKLTDAETLLSWVPYGKKVLYPSKVYTDFFGRCQATQFTGFRTDGYENTRFVRGPGWGKLYTQCMYRSTVTRLFEQGEDLELRYAMSRRFGGRLPDDPYRDKLLEWLGCSQPSPADRRKLARYLSIGNEDDEAGDEYVVNELWQAQAQGHKIALLSDGNLFLGCEYSQVGDSLVLIEGIHRALVVRSTGVDEDVMFVECAALVGLQHVDVMTEGREELVLV